MSSTEESSIITTITPTTVATTNKKRKLSLSDEKDSKSSEKKIMTRLLIDNYPHIYNQIHPIKNNDIDIESLTDNSEEEIWWVCDDHKSCRKHKWKMTVIERVRGNNCIWCFGKKYCGCPLQFKLTKGAILFRDKYPDLVCEIIEELNPTINLHTLSISNRYISVTWKCRFDTCGHHIWKCTVSSRRDCGFCSGTKACECKSLVILYPKMANQIDRNKHPNINLKNIHPGYSIPLNWVCTNPDVKCNHHRWIVSPHSRTRFNTDCTYCAHTKICECDSFAMQSPHLLKEVDMKIHGDIDFKSISPKSNMIINWVCSKHTTCDEHRWTTSIGQRTRKHGRNCPYCSNRKVCKCSSLETLFPKIAREINKKLSKLDASIIAPYSDIRVNWKCSKCKHKWNTILNSRTRYNTGCPKCAMSGLEITFKEAIEELGIKYEIQYKFDECRNVLPLPFDFYLPDINALIELDGPHHFEEINYHNNKKNLKSQRERDTIKTKFTKKKDINFLRISHSEMKNIEAYATTFIVLCIFRKFFGGERIEKFYGKEYDEKYRCTHV